MFLASTVELPKCAQRQICFQQHSVIKTKVTLNLDTTEVLRRCHNDTWTSLLHQDLKNTQKLIECTLTFLCRGCSEDPQYISEGT